MHPGMLDYVRPMQPSEFDDAAHDGELDDAPTHPGELDFGRQ